jgi:hypothetical protein
VADAVLLFDEVWVARIQNENSDMNSLSASSPDPSKGSQVTGVRSTGVSSSYPVDDFVVVKEVESKLGIRRGSCCKCSRVELESEDCGPSQSMVEMALKPIRMFR